MTETTLVSLSDRVRDLITSGQFQLPPIPELAVKLRTALDDDDTNVQEIANLIRNEPAIAASLLRTANSAAFGGLKSITDLGQAISRLGLAKVQTMVTALLVQGQFEGNHESNSRMLETLWNHAIASASVASNLASREDYSRDDAFLAGLLHGIGRLLVLRGLDRLSQIDPDVALAPEAVEELVEGLQFDLGYATLRSWNLSDDICDSARAMDPEMSQPDRPIIRIVQAADVIAQKLGMHPHPNPDLNLMDQDAIESLEIGDVGLGALIVDLEDKIDEVRSAFGAG